MCYINIHKFLSLNMLMKIISKNTRTITLWSSFSSINVKFGTKISSSKLSRSQNPSLISSSHSLRVGQKYILGHSQVFRWMNAFYHVSKPRYERMGLLIRLQLPHFFQIKLQGHIFNFADFSGVFFFDIFDSSYRGLYYCC